MARISGVDLPRDKKVEVGLSYIYGIGRKNAAEIVQKAGIDASMRIRDLYLVVAPVPGNDVLINDLEKERFDTAIQTSGKNLSRQVAAGKISDEDKETILSAVQETVAWLDEEGKEASAEDFEEKREQLSQTAYPITSKLYGDAPGGGADEEPSGHEYVTILSTFH